LKLTDIDITFDFRGDTPKGRDPDAYSKTLRGYHKLLWSKPLPGGTPFILDDETPGAYLHHKSTLGEFSLASDAVIPSFRWAPDILTLVSPEELEAFNTAGYTIGGMMLFPGNQINRQWSINQARGITRAIRDRFDLTLECIRRHYGKLDSPLSTALGRYSSFFELFGDFPGYVDFFLLQDLVTDDYGAVRFSLPFDDFRGSPVPQSASAYNAYRQASCAFIAARNQRMKTWALEERGTS
jgi:hypothetical protein